LAPGRPHTIAFVVMAGTAWTLPLYELALMTAEYGRRRGLDLAIEVISSESAPLGVFGAEARAAVRRRLDDAGVRIRSGASATEYADGELRLELEGPLDVDLVIALPHLRGTRLPGLPHESGGFVPVDGYGRVRGVERVWAVGDMTARPLKQGGLASPAGRCRRGRHRLANRRRRDRGAPLRAQAPGHAADGRRPALLERDLHAGPQQKVVGAHLSPYLEALDGQVASVRRS
jgi:sulfide:quinone oxidoreductase